MEPLFKNDRYTELANTIDVEASILLRPIINKYSGVVSMRELQLILTNLILELTLTEILLNSIPENKNV